MKVCLIFTPFCSNSYIPLGISYLKSFVEKNIPSVHVRNLDLSSNFYHNLDNEKFLRHLPYLCLICPVKRKSECKGILRKKEFTHWQKVALVSKGSISDSKTNDFYNANKYNKLKRLYDVFYNRINLCISQILKHSLEFPEEKNDIILENNLFKDDINKILSLKPEIVGFSIFSKEQLYYSCALARILKTKINLQIIFGGASISHLDKKALLQIFDFIDFIIYKEGELGIVSLLKNLKKDNLDQVPNLVYRERGKIIENEESAVQNLDDIPFPDFSDYNLKDYFTPQPVVSTLLSRGCYWGACSFCAVHKTFSKPYRIRSISNIIHELKNYQKKRIRYIWFADEIVAAADLDRINKAILKRRLKIYYGIMLKPTKDFSSDILKRMHQAGCRVVFWGVESFSQRVLNLMNKGIDSQETIKVLKAAHTVGLSNVLLMIRNFPLQTEEEILKDAKVLKKISKYFIYVGMHNFWLRVDTVIFQNSKKFGLKCLKRRWLLKTKKYKLFDDTVSFANEESIDWKRLNKLLTKNQYKYNSLYKFKDAMRWPHMLLHLSNSHRIK